MKIWVAEQCIKSFEWNKKKLDPKSGQVSWALAAILAQGLFLGVAGICSLFG